MKKHNLIEKAKNLPWPKAVSLAGVELSFKDSYNLGKIVRIHLQNENGEGLSLRRLQRNVLQSISLSTISRCIQIYEVLSRLGMDPESFTYVKPGHVFRVAVYDKVTQKNLLMKVEREKMSVSAFQNHLTRIRPSVPRSGRKPVPRFIKTMKSVSSPDSLADLDCISIMNERDVVKLINGSEAFIGRLTKLTQLLNQRRKFLTDKSQSTQWRRRRGNIKSDTGFLKEIDFKHHAV